MTPKTKKLLGVALVTIAVVGLSAYYLKSNKQNTIAAPKPKTFKDGDVVFDSSISEMQNFPFMFYKGGWYILEDINLDQAIAEKAIIPITKEDFTAYKINLDGISNTINPALVNEYFINTYGV